MIVINTSQHLDRIYNMKAYFICFSKLTVYLITEDNGSLNARIGVDEDHTVPVLLEY